MAKNSPNLLKSPVQNFIKLRNSTRMNLATEFKQTEMVFRIPYVWIFIRKKYLQLFRNDPMVKISARFLNIKCKFFSRHASSASASASTSSAPVSTRQPTVVIKLRNLLTSEFDRDFCSLSDLGLGFRFGFWGQRSREYQQLDLNVSWSELK